MATVRNKEKLAAVKSDNHEEHLRKTPPLDTNVPGVNGVNEDYITQVSEQIEVKVTKKFSQDLSRTEDRILGALFELDDFF